MHRLSTPEQLFSTLLATDAGRPFVTYYDEASGERSELSVRSLANWVAKTHYLIVDELALQTGDTALILLPPHWISVPVLLGCLTAGLDLGIDPAPAAVAFVEPATASSAAGVPDIYTIAPSSAAVGLGDSVPPGTLDYVGAVRPQADSWAGVRLGADDDDLCLDGLTRGDVVERAHARAVELGVAEGGRVLSTRDWSGPSDWLDTLIVPLVVGGSVVYVRNASEEVIERRVAQERVTARV